MRTPLPVATRRWLIVALVHLLFVNEIFGAIWIMDILLIAAISLAGLTISVWWIVRAFRTIRVVKSLAICILCFTLTAFCAIPPYSGLLGTYFKFYRNLSRYQSTVAEIEQSDLPSLDEMAHYPDYIIDKGPPVRVAFIWYGWVDNISALPAETHEHWTSPGGLLMR